MLLTPQVAVQMTQRKIQRRNNHRIPAQIVVEKGQNGSSVRVNS